jgi:hypothetical protein
MTVVLQAKRKVVVLSIAVARKVFIEAFIGEERSTNDHVATIEKVKGSVIAERTGGERGRILMAGDQIACLFAADIAICQEMPGQGGNAGIPLQELRRFEEIIGMQFDIVVDKDNPIDLGRKILDSSISLFCKTFDADDDHRVMF